MQKRMQNEHVEEPFTKKNIKSIYKKIYFELKKYL